VHHDEHSFYRFAIGMDTDCESFIQHLVQDGIGAARPVFLPIHRHLKTEGYSLTDNAWQTTLSIPIYPSLHETAIDQVISRFIKIFKKRSRQAAR
jgi:dTDP-4-amino-4,6-dideoxygalactose transaminase